MSYGYYKTSSRGRGFSSRGSYRGRGGDSSFYSRGTYRGRSSWQTDRSSAGFDSRSRYTSGATSRGQIDDSGYRRYGREEEVDYSGHDRSYHRSPESSRKRMRSDLGYTQASSARRTHEGGYEGGADYSNRYSYSDDKEGYGYREERRPTGGFRDRSRDEYSHRKQEPLEVSMPPPSSGSSRYVSSVRGSYRGRIRTRGFRGISKLSLARRTSSFLARKRSLVDPNAVRKRIVSARTQADTLRRLRILKLRRLREAALLRRAVISSKKEGKAKEDSSKATEDISDEEEEDDEEDENEKEKSEEKEEKVNVSKKKKKVKKEEGDKDNEEEKEGDEKEDVDEDEDEEVEDDEDNDEKTKAEAASNGDAHPKDDAADDDTRARSALFRGRPFIKLNCPHCYTRCITFQEYNAHLYSFKHINAVRKLWRLHKTVLTQLRVRQRQRQRIIDKKKEEGDGLPLKTKYCIVCKLNYGDLKTEHVASEYHKKILDFMKPYCRICKFKLSSPMMYEKHLCSLDHIKRKALLGSEKDLLKDSGSGAEEDEEKDLDLENFMTLDSVGTFDDTGEENKKGDDDKLKKEKDEKKTKTENLGGEHIKKVSVQYCELCRMYLSRSDQSEKSLTMHCRSRTHLTFYMRHRRRMERKEAEERQMKLLAKKKAKNETPTKKTPQEQEENEDKMDVDKDTISKPGDSAEDNSSSPSKENKKSLNKSADVSSDTVGDSHEVDPDLETDEKMWADVDKDLGDILREVEPGNKSSDEDDDGTEGGRYDRFKYSEKGSIIEDGKATKEGEDQPAEMDVEEDQTVKAPADPKSGTPSPVKKAALTPAATSPTATAASK
ncbi:uncharacterized protein [Anabrus simplex]|uniref:uncharacterized protein n=1 Tax=Anabrus simplex TaxID=316456 RepID=UPI0035A34798